MLFFKLLLCTSLVVHCKYEAFFIHEQVLEQKINVYYDWKKKQEWVVQVVRMGLEIKKKKNAFCEQKREQNVCKFKY